MKTESALEGGVTGATTLTILHEVVRMIDRDAPRMDEIGKEALRKLLKKLNLDIPDEDILHVLTTGTELLANGLFYSLVGAGDKDNVYAKGAILGLAAGVGAVMLPDKLGLDNRASNRTTKTKLMTIAWYLIGGIVASAVAKKLEEKRSRSFK
jgi:hypothetical protein